MTKASDIAKELQKAYAKKSNLYVDVSLLSADDSPCIISDWVSTGTVVLDAIMGGGLPVGRLTEIYGDPSSGKSLIAAQAAAIAQQDGYTVAYIDTESTLSLPMVDKLGVNVDELIYCSPDTVEEVFDFMDNTIEIKKQVDPDGKLVLIWDSVAATSSIAEMDKDYGKTGYLDQARIISQSMRKITRKIRDDKVAALFLNQTREKMGVMFGEKETMFGGKAIPFHASVRIALHTGAKLKAPGKKKAKIVGMVTRAVVTKNKVAMPFREAQLPIYFGHAIDDPQASLMWLTDNGFIEFGGSWKYLQLKDERIRFQPASWPAEYDAHYEEIGNLIMDAVSEGEDEYGELPEGEEE